jgi:hypothetical protein
MPRTLRLATTLMDVTPAPTAERLARAERLVAGAAQGGAQLVVLPELFNTGYAYSPDNFARAEPLDGPTAAWMKEQAARLGVHLAGTLLLRDDGEIYNSLLLVAPNGRTWRYDKRYPWAWERGYFRAGRGTTVAQTDLGAIGMLICWDTAHRELWQAYAGQVDLMLVSSCPPEINNPTFTFPDGARLTLDDFGPLMAAMQDTGRVLFGTMFDEQAVWLGVPAVQAMGCGRFESAVPRGRLSLLPYVLATPRLARHLRHADQVRMACDMVPGCKVVAADGQALAARNPAQGEGFAGAALTLPDARPAVPAAPQPPSRLPALAYFTSDVLLPWIARGVYDDRVKR